MISLIYLSHLWIGIKKIFNFFMDKNIIKAYADTSKIKNELNWTTKYSLENALKTAWNWELNINKNE